MVSHKGSMRIRGRSHKDGIKSSAVPDAEPAFALEQDASG
jgi:hypothetical protein